MPVAAAVGTFLGTSAGAATVAGGLGLAGSVLGARSQTKAAKNAANAQVQSNDAAIAAQERSSQAAIAEQQRQFDYTKGLLNPYVQSGYGALGQQQDMLGLHGGGAQQSIIDSLQNSPFFKAQLQQGNNALLQNAAATGGLRGGNIQSALGQFAPNLLNQVFQNHYANLGGLTNLGQNAAAGTGQAAMGMANTIGQIGTNAGNNTASLLSASGDARANAALSQGATSAGLFSGIGNLASNGILGYYGKGPMAGLF